MSGPAIASHAAAQSAPAAVLTTTKFVKHGAESSSQAAFDAVLQKFSTNNSQRSAGDRTKSGADDAAKSDVGKEDGAQEGSKAGDLTSSLDADPAAAIAALVAPQTGADSGAAAIAALLAPQGSANASAAQIQAQDQTSASTVAGVNLHAFGSKASSSATQSWAARLQAQSRNLTDAGSADDVKTPSDSTAQIALTATPTVAPDVIDVHVESARTFLGLDNSAQMAKLAAENAMAASPSPPNGATPSSAAAANTMQSATAVPSAPASNAPTNIVPPSGAMPTPAATQDAVDALLAVTGSTAASGDARPVGNTTQSTSGQATVGQAGALNTPAKSATPSLPVSSDKADSATGWKTASSIQVVAPASSNAGQQSGGGATRRGGSNDPGGASGSSNNPASAAGTSAAANTIATSNFSTVATSAAAAIGPLSIDQLPDAIANQAAALAGSSSSATASDTTTANLNPVKELQVQLNPADLGSLTVKMRLANGNLAVVIETSKDSTAKMIEGERNAIAERLASVDQPVASVTVQASDSVPYQGENSNGSGATPQQGDAQSGAASGSNGQSRQSRNDRQSEAGQTNAQDNQASGRTLSGDLFV